MDAQKNKRKKNFIEHNLLVFKEENLVHLVTQEKFEETIIFFQKTQYFLLQLLHVENFLEDKNLSK